MQRSEERESVLASEVRRVIGSSGLAGIWNVCGQALSIVVGVIAARMVGAGVFGAVSVGVSVVAALQIVGTLGTERGTLKFVSHYFGRRDLRSVRRAGLFATCIAATSSITLTFAYYLFFRKHGHSLFSDVVGIDQVLDVLVAITPIACLVFIYSAAVTGLQKPQCAQFANAVLRPATQLLGLTLLYFVTSRLLAFTVATALSYCVAAVYVVGRFWRALACFSSESGPSHAEDESLTLRQFLAFSVPLTFVPALVFAGQQLDIMLVGHFVGGDGAGVYAAARRVANVMTVPLLVTGGVTAATVSKLLARSDRRSVVSIYTVVSRWIYFASATLFAIIITASETILSVFGGEFTTGATALKVLAIGQLVKAAVGPSGNTLLVVGRERLLLFNSVFSALVGLLLAMLLIPRYALVGAAVATAITTSSINLVSALQLFVLERMRAAQFRTWLKRTVLLLAAVVLCRMLANTLAAGAGLIVAVGIVAVAIITVLGALWEGLRSEEIGVIRYFWNRVTGGRNGREVGV